MNNLKALNAMTPGGGWHRPSAQRHAFVLKDRSIQAVVAIEGADWAARVHGTVRYGNSPVHAFRSALDAATNNAEILLRWLGREVGP